jgi:hypothetical protein
MVDDHSPFINEYTKYKIYNGCAFNKQVVNNNNNYINKNYNNNNNIIRCSLGEKLLISFS